MLPTQLEKKVVCAVLALFTMVSVFPSNQGAFAAAGEKGIAEFDYPELAVTPRASERLEMEAAKEQSASWAYLPIQVSAATTLVAGILQVADQNPDKPSLEAGLTGAAIGGTWLVLTALLSARYEPYLSAQKEINGMPKRTQREQLLRERLAEEKIEAAAGVARRMKWLSVASHVGAGVYMAANAVPKSAALVAAGASIVTAFTPIIFAPKWEQIARDQRDYKKKIYAPIANATILPEPVTAAPAPGMILTFLF